MNEPVSSAASHLCAACACCCDDLTLVVENARTTLGGNACEKAQLSLESASDNEPVAWIDGRPAPLDSAVARAAELLGNARLPVVYGCVDSTVETQALAVKLARQLRGVFDSPALPDAPLFPGVGTISCSLGEAMNRADLIVLWNCDPDATHPRLLSRYLLEPAGRFRPHGRRDRTLVVVGRDELARKLRADESVTLADGQDFAALWSLRTDLHRPTHSRLEAGWRTVSDRMRAARFGALAIDRSAGPRVIEAAQALATELQKKSRFYVLVLPEPGNATGVRQVVAWLSGQCAPVCFARPESPLFGGEFRTKRLIERQECDAVLTIGAISARIPLRSIPQIRLSARISELSQLPAVAIRTAAFPISDFGTVFRLDGIALPLRVTIPSSAPSQFAVLNHIAQKLRPAAD